MVRSEKKKDFCFWKFLGDGKEGIARVANLPLPNLMREHFELGMFAGNPLKHRKPVRCLKKGFFDPKWSVIGRAEEEGVKLGLFNCLFSEGKVTVVNRVKGAAEKTDPWQ